MKAKEGDQNDENFWFRTPEPPGTEDGHTPIRQRILKGIRASIKNRKLDRKEDAGSRKKFLDLFKKGRIRRSSPPRAQNSKVPCECKIP